MEKKIVIVGGVAGGASAAARLRRLDEHAQIVMLERGEYISFANCGLPYYIGGTIRKKATLTLQTPESFHRRFNIDVRIQSEVTSISPAEKKVTIYDHRTKESYEETYDKLILSMGAEPMIPDLPGMQSEKVFTLRNIPDAYRITDYIDQYAPKTVVVVGGGSIGIEMVENLHARGIAVTLVEKSSQVLPFIDDEMACDVHHHLRSKGVRLLLGKSLKAVHPRADCLQLELDDAQITADLLILAIGVRPDTKLAREAELVLNGRGAIVVDAHMVTCDPDIYAVGDAVESTDYVTKQKGSFPLAGPANKQGRIAADNICGIPSTYNGTQGSAIVKVFDLTVAATGINERTAKSKNLNYDKAFTYSPNHAGYYPGAVNMSIKTIFEKNTGKILGAQIVGYDGVDKRCDVLATALRAGMTASDLTALELCYAPPYGSAKDPVNMVGFVIENTLRGNVQHFHWHDVMALPRDGSVTLLDTRTPIEYENGHIGGFMNIPLDSLRSHLDQLDVTKPIYLTCQIGLRGYVAARILMQHGFQVFNLSGGYRLYQSVTMDQLLMETQGGTVPKQQEASKVIRVDVCGLSCPQPLEDLSSTLEDIETGDVVEFVTTDAGLSRDIEHFCKRTGNTLLSLENEKGVSTVKIQKGN